MLSYSKDKHIKHESTDIQNRDSKPQQKLREQLM